MRRKFFGFELECLPFSPRGHVNMQQINTGDYNIAGQLYIFNTRKKRNEWAEENPAKNKIIIGKSQIRNFFKGMDFRDYKQMLEKLDIL